MDGSPGSASADSSAELTEPQSEVLMQTVDNLKRKKEYGQLRARAQFTHEHTRDRFKLLHENTKEGTASQLETLDGLRKKLQEAEECFAPDFPLSLSKSVEPNFGKENSYMISARNDIAQKVIKDCQSVQTEMTRLKRSPGWKGVDAKDESTLYWGELQATREETQDWTLPKYSERRQPVLALANTLDATIGDIESQLAEVSEEGDKQTLAMRHRFLTRRQANLSNVWPERFNPEISLVQQGISISNATLQCDWASRDLKEIKARNESHSNESNDESELGSQANETGARSAEDGQ